MEVRITLFTRYDVVPTEEFEETYSDWADGTPYEKKVGGDGYLSMETTMVTPKTRTVTQAGLHGASRQKIGPISPPKYPPVYVCQYLVDDSLLSAIAADNRFYILAVDDIGEGVPGYAEGRGYSEPIPQDIWDEFSAKVVAVTRNLVGDEAADHLDAFQQNWWTPERTPDDYCKRLHAWRS